MKYYCEDKLCKLLVCKCFVCMRKDRFCDRFFVWLEASLVFFSFIQTAAWTLTLLYTLGFIDCGYCSCFIHASIILILTRKTRCCIWLNNINIDRHAASRMRGLSVYTPHRAALPWTPAMWLKCDSHSVQRNVYLDSFRPSHDSLLLDWCSSRIHAEAGSLSDPGIVIWCVWVTISLRVLVIAFIVSRERLNRWIKFE